MKGTRPLDNDKIRSVSTGFTGTFEVRNRRLFMLGVSTGRRMSELLTNLTYRTAFFAFLIAMLTIHAPVVILAQQNSAETQAKDDADSDVNQIVWFAGGLISTLPILGVAALNVDSDSRAAVCLTFLGGSVLLVPIYYANGHSTAPPTDRLLGKSPEYVTAYTDIYVKKVKQIRVLSTLAGIGTVVIPRISCALIGDADPDLGINLSDCLSQ